MYGILSQSPFFLGLTPDELEALFKGISFSVRSFAKGQTIAQREEEVRSLCIVVQGVVKGEMVDSTGKVLKVEEMPAPQPIAHAFLFGDRNRYPVDVVALTDCQLLFIPRAEAIRLLQGHETILSNYLNAIANRAQFLASKLWFLSFRTIREKVAHYLLGLARAQRSTTLRLPKSHQELAELFGVTRPALARVLAEMQDEGVLVVDRREVTITSRERLVQMIR